MPVTEVTTSDVPVAVPVNVEPIEAVNEACVGPVVPSAVVISCAAFEKLVAPDRLILLDVTGVPLIGTVRTPVSACNLVSVNPEIVPPRIYAPTAFGLYCVTSKAAGSFVPFVTPPK